jgi:hypothetical protein
LLEKMAGCKAPAYCIKEEPVIIEPIKIEPEDEPIIEKKKNIIETYIADEEVKPEPSEYDEQEVEEVVTKKVRVKKTNQKYIIN